jgi:hypothetical protein
MFSAIEYENTCILLMLEYGYLNWINELGSVTLHPLS